ncbi:putative membrane protein YccC [Actinoplanes tereljensis]|uniref:FUSC family protein n=1 Tax=Paractinoplanes tereljensis TaxID=571912 RepID=A0A919NKH4_9ACTN|nr:FUSC family protein [Actinoplanes tereljensis]GIF20424.1 FUSC family protein [Actinoplanes tereljensis]
MGWLRRRDPQLLAVRRAARVTLVACLGFYVCRYLLDAPAMAPYALFGAVALGALSQIPGTPKRRAGTLLAVLPVAWILVSLGTLLSVSNVAAAAGMFLFGFVVSYVGVGGPRLAGLAAGMQLLYILPCFPPYDPGSLRSRLAGVTCAIVLFAVAEVTLWPDPVPTPYTARLADAIDSLAACLAAVADSWEHQSKDRLAELLPEATDRADALRPSRLPPLQRPASAGRRDRALSAAAGTARLLLGRAVDLFFTEQHEAVTLPAATHLVRRTAGCTASAAAWLRGQGPLPDTDQVAAALSDFRIARMNTDPSGLAPERLRLGALALALGEWTKSLVVAIRLAAGERPAHVDPTGPFWYAYRSTPSLYWHRLRENLTPRSVAFQGALRLAAALAVARLLAGELDLSHGFWVLLTILTVLRTSAAETRSALRPALVGTVAGSLVAAVLLVVGVHPTVYAFVLPVVMLVGFAAGPLLGLGWSQALFTLVITLVFAQVTPVDWRLAEARVLDVLLGAGIGILAGLFAWPRGGGGELHRAAGTFLGASAGVIRETVAVMAEGQTPGAALPQARLAGQLADASFALYQSERHPAAAVDWQATLLAGHHAVRGAEALVRSCPAGGLLPCVAPLTAAAADVAGRYDRAAADLSAHRRTVVEPLPAAVEWPTDLGQDLYTIADLRVWLDGLREDLGRIPGLPEPGDELRVRVSRVADGAS